MGDEDVEERERERGRETQMYRKREEVKKEQRLKDKGTRDGDKETNRRIDEK